MKQDKILSKVASALDKGSLYQIKAAHHLIRYIILSDLFEHKKALVSSDNILKAIPFEVVM